MGSSSSERVGGGHSRHRAMLIAAALLTVLALVFGLLLWQHARAKAADQAVAATVPVELTAGGAGKDVTVGVVSTFGHSDGAGAQWNQAGQGAGVAQQRFALGGADVKLVTQNDRGTDEGAREAVAMLADEGAAGLVVTTSGPQITELLRAAQERQLPVILGHQPVPGGAGEHVWSLASADDHVREAVRNAVSSADRVVQLNADGRSELLTGVGTSTTVAARADLGELARSVRATAGGPNSAVVVNASADRAGDIVRALQGAGVKAKFVLSPDALSPSFTESLLNEDGSLSADMVTVGHNAYDPAALAQSPQGRAMSAFLNGIRVMRENPDLKNLSGDRAFADSADRADSVSHDAVVSLVRAAESAGSRKPSRVGEELATMDLGAPDGVAGPELRFHNTQYPAGQAELLWGSQQDLGLRRSGPSDVPQLVWFVGEQHSTQAGA